jgi:hypothetical protein
MTRPTTSRPGPGFGPELLRAIGAGLIVSACLIGLGVSFFATTWTAILAGAIIGAGGWLTYNAFKIVAVFKRGESARQRLLNALFCGSPIFTAIAAALMHYRFGRAAEMWSVIALVIIAVMGINIMGIGLLFKKPVSGPDSTAADSTATGGTGWPGPFTALSSPYDRRGL